MPPGLHSEKQLKTECIWITMPECPCQYSQPKCSHVHSLLRTLRNEYQTKVKAKAALETWFQLLYQTVSNIFSSQNDRESQKLWPCLRFDRFLVAGDVTPEADIYWQLLDMHSPVSRLHKSTYWHWCLLLTTFSLCSCCLILIMGVFRSPLTESIFEIIYRLGGIK